MLRHPLSKHSWSAASVRSHIGVATVVVASLLALLLGCPTARANGYTGLLYGGTLNMGSNAQSESGGFVYGANSWTAPAGVQFNGFAYTSAAFSSVSDNSVGGVSAGFGGDGTANQPTILFPWTADCSISNSGHYWGNSWGLAVAGTAGTQSCNTAGNTSNWAATNIEMENGDPAVNPQSGYHTLWLSVFCQAVTCNYDSGRQWGAAGLSVTNLSGSFVDPDSQPSGSAAWGSQMQAYRWYQTNGGGVSLNLSASDPAGVCALYAGLTGASNVVGGVVGHENPGVVNVGGAIGGEFEDGTSPCWTGQTDSGTWILPGGLPAGWYSVDVYAANPGDYESQGFSAANSPLVASYSNVIEVDDSTPTLSWANAASTWTSQTSETLDVSAGPSGVSAVTCTDNGSSDSATLLSGSTAGAGTTTWAVPTPANGANNVSCTAGNGDVNGALVGAATRTFDVDSTVPTVSFMDAGYVQGSWTNQSQTVQVRATGGPGGIHTTTCSMDGSAGAELSNASGGTVTVTGDGEHTLRCVAVSNTNVQGSATYHVNIDAEQPTLSFLVNGTAPSTTYLSGAPVVTVVGGEDGGILSGLSQISCSVNGGAPFLLSGIGAAGNYTGSFELEQNGTDHVSCIGKTVAGSTQVSPSNVTVNVDNPNYAANASALIDDGADPYSNGPSQSQWYVTPQSVTVTADNTGGGAPIASISCKGALTGTWPISAVNSDSRGGEQITLTVPAPGGDLSCAAQDTAGNVYVLGSYLFQIDQTPPTGYFLPTSSWPQPDEISIHAGDGGGSGVSLVRVYGESPDVEQGAPQFVGDAQYDPGTHDYVVTIPDGVAPWVAGGWKFYANVVDVAGNQGEITTEADGATEELTLPLREATAVTASADQVAATPEVAIPDPLATVALPGLSQPSGTAAADTRRATASAARDAAPRAHALTVRYGSTITIRGSLTDVTHHGVPISGATVVVYEQLVGSHRYQRLGESRTNAAGDYRYRVRPGASRTLYVLYPGSSQLRPAASQLSEHSAGSLTLHATEIRAGGALILTGRVRGGHIPSGGLEVTIEYRQLGAPGSGTLGTVRTDRDGSYRFTQHFSSGTRGLTYQVWSVVPRGQSGWPYAGASSVHRLRRVR